MWWNDFWDGPCGLYPGTLSILCRWLFSAHSTVTPWDAVSGGKGLWSKSMVWNYRCILNANVKVDSLCLWSSSKPWPNSCRSPFSIIRQRVVYGTKSVAYFYLTRESYMYRKQGSLVTFISIYLLVYLVAFILICSWRWDNVLRYMYCLVCS